MTPDLFTLPTADWAGTLVGISLAVVSAVAAVYSSAHLSWVTDLDAAVDATIDARGKIRARTTAEGARAYAHLKRHRTRDPRRSLGWVAALVAGFMTVIGIVAGLQVPKVGLLFTIAPIALSAALSFGAVLLPGGASRKAADDRLAAIDAIGKS
jgi:peptidoglycan/LPS O-acetylase OafA/YrhL